MRTIRNLAVVDDQRCTACDICVRICPVRAIALEKQGEKKWLAVVDGQKCVDCRLCVVRCPHYALAMVERDEPMEIGTVADDVWDKAIAGICESAHMYPDQVICYCHRVQAREIVAAVLQGAHSPEDVALATGARTGCGVLCITGVIRLLRAAGVMPAKAPGYQWYGINASIWDVKPDLQEKYSQYYLAEDLQAMNELFPGEEEQNR